ncbi:MAG: MaoC family dehydratase N-terminal domain-containing protein [Burkholderiales bacterium]|jgi:3-methylfumaryl-CoA hydratase|nr:MaoC family dehydratase N-terminal domain-containing protein [Burkholderiales bacterium]
MSKAFASSDDGNQNVEAWIGRQEVQHDLIGPTPVMALNATLDYPASEVVIGQALPMLWHWLYFLPSARQREIGPDGHAKRGGFLPPISLPRRMWAGSQLEFFRPIRIGDQVSRTSTITNVSKKDGRTGPLVFVTVKHEIRCNRVDDPALVEFQDIVYRDAKKLTDTEPPPIEASKQASWQQDISPDPVMLFRYSALTFNGHRIHYDRSYTTSVEGYPGLVVHGPLIASLLMELVRRNMPEAEVARFKFKAIRPTFDLHAFKVKGQCHDDPKTINLWGQDHEGFLTMDGVAELR